MNILKKIRKLFIDILILIGVIKTPCKTCTFHGRCAGEYEVRVVGAYSYLKLKFTCDKYEEAKK